MGVVAIDVVQHSTAITRATLCPAECGLMTDTTADTDEIASNCDGASGAAVVRLELLSFVERGCDQNRSSPNGHRLKCGSRSSVLVHCSIIM